MPYSASGVSMLKGKRFRAFDVQNRELDVG